MTRNMDLLSIQKRLTAALKASKSYGKASTANDRLKHLAALADAMEVLAGSDLRAEITRQVEAIRSELESGLRRRREAIANAAHEKGWTYTRYEQYERIGNFEVHYAGEKVSIRLGSEHDCELVDADGSKTVKHLVDRQVALMKMLLPRDRFFTCLQAALAMAVADGRSQEGKVAVRDLYPYVALRRQLESDKFAKRPGSAFYTNYSLAEFAFELMQFGQDPELGWTCCNRRLCNRSPAMSTQDRAIRLPGSTNTQVYMLWIE